MIFNLPPILALLPLIIYVVLAFKEDLHPLLNVLICVILSAIMTKQPLLELGGVLANSLGSFLALIGFIIMLGSALAAVLRATGTAEFIVVNVMKKIGINTERKAIISSMIVSFVLVSLLGTMAGANAIIAPIIIPLVATIGLTPSTLACIFLGAGITGLFIGPYSPQVVTLLDLLGMNYGNYVITVGLPLAVVVWLVTYFMANRIQKKTKGVYSYEDVGPADLNISFTKEAKRATLTFVIALAALIGYGIYLKSGSSYAIVVIFTTALLTGLLGGMKVNDLFTTMLEGAGKMVWLFIIFVLFDPFILFVSEAGGFDALVELLTPLMMSSNKLVFTLITSLTGIFGIGGAAVAESVLLQEMFGNLATNMALSTPLWASIILVASQITSFAYPEADMLGQMGLAQSKDLKNMVKYGLTVVAASMVYVLIRSLIG